MNSKKYKISLPEAIAKLNGESSQRFTILLQHGSMQIEYFKPDKIDTQTPHSQDEIYIVISGSGTFLRNNEKITFMANDVLFVPAGMEHRFIDFTDDFSTWVIFYGPKGGEKDQ